MGKKFHSESVVYADLYSSYTSIRDLSGIISTALFRRLRDTIPPSQQLVVFRQAVFPEKKTTALIPKWLIPIKRWMYPHIMIGPIYF